MAQLSDDCFAHGSTLMTTAQARALIDEKITAVTGTETVRLVDGLGRVLAEDLTAPADVPAHDNSAVDGYAVFFEDLNPHDETVLPVTGRATAGHPLGRAAWRGEAIRIFTGARMPEGPDTVMMQEDCRLDGDRVAIRPGIKRGANRRARGEDIQAGTRVLATGTRLRPQDLGLAASIGRQSLSVSRPLRLALFSTGDELREPGTPLDPGCIYDSNRFTVTGLLRGLGCVVEDFGILPDQLGTIENLLSKAATEHDLLITSGGVSVGEEDHVKQAVQALGHLHLWRLAIKPGRPIALGQIGAVPFVGLPGNPVAVVVTFLILVRPMILRMLGALAAPPQYFKVSAAFSHRKKPSRREWLRVHLRSDGNGTLEAHKFPRDGAGILSSLVESDGLVELPENLAEIEPGTLVDFLPFSEVLR